jgi:tRNA(Ile)-lysidine synthase
MANSRKSPSIDAAAALSAAVTRCLTPCVHPGAHVTVALSGGIDSVCLLHVLVQLVHSGHCPLVLSAVHVHHGLSPHADHWEAFCQEYCASLQVPCSSVHVTVDRHSKEGLEGAARRVRHAVFDAIATDWVLLAHHRGDQAETLLFNLLRGCGLAGAAAMRERNGRLLRPFLQLGREEIELYARHHGLSWCEDESNADERHARNFLRQNIVPQLAVRFPAAVASLAGAAARFAEAKDLLDELARADLPAGHDGFPVRIDVLQALGEVRARNVLRYLLAKNQVQIPSEPRLREALRQMLAAGQDRHPVVVFGRHCLRRQRGWVYLEAVEGWADSS